MCDDIDAEMQPAPRIVQRRQLFPVFGRRTVHGRVGVRGVVESVVALPVVARIELRIDDELVRRSPLHAEAAAQIVTKTHMCIVGAV